MHLQGPAAVVRVLAPDLLNAERQSELVYVASRLSGELQVGGPALVDDLWRTWVAAAGGMLSVAQLVERTSAQLGLPENKTMAGSVGAPSGQHRHANYDVNSRFLQEFLDVSG